MGRDAHRLVLTFLERISHHALPKNRKRETLDACIENVPLSRIALRYRDSVTVILTASCLRTYVMSRAVTEQIVTQSFRPVEFTV